MVMMFGFSTGLALWIGPIAIRVVGGSVSRAGGLCRPWGQKLLEELGAVVPHAERLPCA